MQKTLVKNIEGIDICAIPYNFRNQQGVKFCVVKNGKEVTIMTGVIKPGQSLEYIFEKYKKSLIINLKSSKLID